MQCSICGKDNQPGMRFCVHCGAAQTPVQPAATTSVIAAMTQAEAPPAARASGRPGLAVDAPISPPTDSTRDIRAATPAAGEAKRMPASPGVEPTGASVAPASESTRAGVAASAIGTASDPAAAPAYSTSPPRKSGMLVVIVLAVIGLLGIGGFFVYKVSEDSTHEAAPASTAAAAPAQASSSESAAAAPAVAPGGATTDTAPAPTPSTEPASAPAPEAKPGDAEPARATSSGPTPAPAVEPPARSAGKASPGRAAQPRPGSPKGSEPAVTQPAATPAPAPNPPRSTTAAPATRAAPAADRWAQMQEELTRCTREDFIARVVCDQRVRLRYCNGYWGAVSQCPAYASGPDHGQ